MNGWKGTFSSNYTPTYTSPRFTTSHPSTHHPSPTTTYLLTQLPTRS